MFKTKSFRNSILVSFFLSLLMSCGTEVGNPVIKRPTTPRVVAQDSLEADLFDLTEGQFESGDEDDASAVALVTGSSAVLNLAGLSCSSNGTQAQATFSADRIRDVSSQTQRYLVSIERQYSVEWTSPQGGLWCDSKNRVRERRALLEGASTLRTGRFARTLEGVGEHSETDYVKAEFVSEGFKKTFFDKVETSDNDLKLYSQVTWNKSRSNIVKTKQGDSSGVSESVVSDSSPLRVLKTFRTENGKLSRTFVVESGKSEISQADGSVVSIEYQDLTFGSASSCYATSGVVVGSVSGTSDSLTFRVDFGKLVDGRPSIEFSDGQTVLLSGVCGD